MSVSVGKRYLSPTRRRGKRQKQESYKLPRSTKNSLRRSAAKNKACKTSHLALFSNTNCSFFFFIFFLLFHCSIARVACSSSFFLFISTSNRSTIQLTINFMNLKISPLFCQNLETSFTCNKIHGLISFLTALEDWKVSFSLFLVFFLSAKYFKLIYHFLHLPLSILVPISASNCTHSLISFFFSFPCFLSKVVEFRNCCYV